MCESFLWFQLIATWLVHKFILVAWPIEKSGLLFSILNRSDFGKEAYGIFKGQIKKNSVKETYPFSKLKNYSVRIVFVGGLTQCQEQFSQFGNSAKFAVKFKNIVVNI